MHASSARLPLAASAAIAMAAAAPAQVTLDFGGFSWTQENCPNTGSEIVSGVVGGATFNVDSDDTTSNITGFPTTVAGGPFDDQVGVLSVLIGDEPSGTRAVNLPFGANIDQDLLRRGLSAGWASGTVGGGGAALTEPTLPNGPGDDFVIFESGSTDVPDGMMIRVRVANAPGGPFFTDWFFAAPTSQHAATNATLHAYVYDLDDLGLGPDEQIDLIEMANIVAADRIDAVGTFNGPGPAPGPFNPFRPGLGVFGGAVEFDGAGDFGTFQDLIFDVGAAGTISFWVNMDDQGRRNQFFEGPGNSGFEFQFRTNSGGQFFGSPNRGAAGNADDFVIQAGGAGGTTGIWTNLQYTWDFATGEMRLYRDGVEVAYLAGFDQNISGWNTVVDTVNGLMSVGRDPGDSSRAFDGLMDDVGWFDDVLDQTDRDTIRTTGVAALAGDGRLVAHWDFDESSGTTAVDNANGIVMTFEPSPQPWVAEGFVLPEQGGAYAMDNPGPDPGDYASFDTPFGNSTFDPDPLYVAVLHDLEELDPLPPLAVVDVEFPGLDPGLVRRCLVLRFVDCSNVNPPLEVELVVEFMNGAASGVATGVDCTMYDCVEAVDPLHSLSRTVDLVDLGSSCLVDLTDQSGGGGENNALIGGNLNGDDFLDILDFGVLFGEFSETYPPQPDPGDTDCDTLAPHVDITGDGMIGAGDFTFIQINFLKTSDPGCCGALVQGGPLRRVSVTELRRRGLDRMVPADLNGDGWLDERDVAVFLSRGFR